MFGDTPRNIPFRELPLQGKPSRQERRHRCDHLNSPCREYSPHFLLNTAQLQSTQLGILVLHRGQTGGLQCQACGRRTSWSPLATAAVSLDVTLSKSSLVSSVRGS